MKIKSKEIVLMIIISLVMMLATTTITFADPGPITPPDIPNENKYPLSPHMPSGPTYVLTGEEHTYWTMVEGYSTKETGEKQDEIYVKFCWGSIECSTLTWTEEDWIGPFNTSERIEVSHIWSEPGNKYICAYSIYNPEQDAEYLKSSPYLEVFVTTELVADAGGPYEGKTQEAIEFVGQCSGGTPPYSYQWDLDNDGAYDDHSGRFASNIWHSPGSYVISLQVTDHIGDIASSTTEVVILKQGVTLLKIYKIFNEYPTFERLLNLFN